MDNIVWVRLDLSGIRKRLEAAHGRDVGSAEVGAWLMDSGFVLGPERGYLATADALETLAPAEIVDQRML